MSDQRQAGLEGAHNKLIAQEKDSLVFHQAKMFSGEFSVAELCRAWPLQPTDTAWVTPSVTRLVQDGRLVRTGKNISNLWMYEVANDE